LSLYYYDYSNFQASVENDAPPPFFETVNAGRAHALGFETSLSARFTDHFKGFLTYSYIDGGFNAFDKDGTYQQLAGNKFRMTPDHSATLGLDWNLPLGNGAEVFVRPSYSWRSHVYFEDDNQPTIEQGAYGLANLRAGIRFDDRWDITVWGNNLADKEYLIDAGNTGLIFGIPTLIPGASRMYGVTLSAKF
ncbi:MAG: TonB-dependent receptor, partial [Pseudoxanthomonas sp.]